MTTPTPGSTHLRDARLRKALEHAPDAQAAAPAAIREAILRQARHAAAPAAAPPLPWWKRMLGSPARAGRPWNTAFASVLLAGVVVGLWWDREVPGPQPDAGTRDLPAAMPPPALEAPDPPRPPPQAPAPAPASTPTPAPAQTEARDAPRASPRPPTPSPVRREESKVAAPNATPPQQPPSALQERSREKQSEATAQDSMAADDTSTTPSSMAAQRRAISARQASDMTSSRAAPAPAAAPGALPSAAAPSPLGANALASRRSATQAAVQEPAAAPQAAGWAALQVLSGAGPARPRSALPADITQAIALMLDTGPTGVPADDPVLLQILLLHSNGQPLGRLDLGSHSLRWTPVGSATPRAFTARVEPALSLRVREGLALK